MSSGPLFAARLKGLEPLLRRLRAAGDLQLAPVPASALATADGGADRRINGAADLVPAS